MGRRMSVSGFKLLNFLVSDICLGYGGILILSSLHFLLLIKSTFYMLKVSEVLIIQKSMVW